MCGIAGVAGPDTDLEVLQRMAEAMHHRGPDAEGYLRARHIGLAFRRLSIIDVARGNQPIFNEDESVAIILNGEIYNHHELRKSLVQRGHRFRTHSDVETVLHLWEDRRELCLSELRGMFALAIWDRRDQSLFLARDRVGKKPLYYSILPGGGIAFASEIKAILQLPGIRREPNLAALDQFLTLHYVPSPGTAFVGINRLQPGHWLRWREGAATVQRYWRLDYEDKLRGSEEELKEELLRLVREAVLIRLESEVPLGAFLSGGVDSSAVVALASEASTRALKTFSIGFEPASFDETRYAQIVAEKFATDHTKLTVTTGDSELIDDIVWHYDQPFGDSSAVPSFHVARITRRHVTVVLNGDGGDESFAGYDRYQLSRYGAYFRLPHPVRFSLQSVARPVKRYLGRGQRLLRAPIRDSSEAYMATLVQLHATDKAWLYADQFRSLPLDQPVPLAYMRGSSHRALLDSMLDADVHNYLPDDMLVKMDVATMAHSLEARSPLLDHKVMEFMARVPADLKLRGGTSKYLLKAAFRGILPDEILNRRKMGFGVPLGRWLREGLKELLVDTVLSDRAMSRGYFNVPAIRQMVQVHLSGSDRFQYLLWDLLLLERWHQMFIDQVQAPERSPIKAGIC